MPTPKYRRKDDHSIVYDAVRYGNENRSWNQDCVARVAKFVLGLDTETRVTLANERIMDVVQPNERRWDPANWMADIEVADWPRGVRFQVTLGDWILKDDQGILSHVKAFEFSQEFEAVPEEVKAYTQFNELADLIYECFPWEGETYQAAAENVATNIIKAGWTKN